ncbi:hypothetical protein ACPOL_0498 [Acidisarcina polymorpha]|uniref:Lipoprotein n=1 Tax=Acidisarcina polymorpha TaxID=2211140 RepID=A0A2Z5FST8_9BACT|nr:hypothetical protein ACPOL_0498 [Acidisarcina polymorpha]
MGKVDSDRIAVDGVLRLFSFASCFCFASACACEIFEVCCGAFGLLP